MNRSPRQDQGRAPLGPDARTCEVKIRLTPAELHQLDAAVRAYNAGLSGDAVRMTRAEFVRSAALALAR